MAKIVELNTSSDGNIRSARVRLATRKELIRPLNLLYPLECGNSKELTDTPESRDDQESPKPKGNTRPSRQAAIQAKKLIQNQLMAYIEFSARLGSVENSQQEH